MTNPSNNPARAAASKTAKRPRAGQFTDHRVANFKTIIKMMAAGDVTRLQVAQAIGVELKAASNYLSEMHRAGATRYVTHPVTGVGKKVTHHLSMNTDAVECFIARLDAPRDASKTRIRVSADPTRHFHLIFTGAMIHPEPVGTPEPDPLALPVNFFRPVRLDDEPLPRAPAAQVARVSFPMPSSFAFVVPA